MSTVDKIKPVFTIVIPMYNAEAYIRGCLESVTRQTYANFECVVVNDGSVDRSPKIAGDFAIRDPRIRVLTTKNQGECLARKTGILAAKGDFLVFCDADDILHPQLLEVVGRVLDETHCDVVEYEFEEIGADQTYAKMEFGSVERDKVCACRVDGLTEALKINGLSLCKRAFRRTLFSGVSYNSGKVKLGEDAFVTLQIMGRHPICCHVSLNLYFYRVYSASKLHSARAADLAFNYSLLTLHMGRFLSAADQWMFYRAWSSRIVWTLRLARKQGVDETAKCLAIYAKYDVLKLFCLPFKWKARICLFRIFNRRKIALMFREFSASNEHSIGGLRWD